MSPNQLFQEMKEGLEIKEEVLIAPLDSIVK
jgi:hypothetical protein